MNYDILFLGKLFPKKTENIYKEKMITGMQDAANAFEWNIIDGLDSNNCGIIKILSYLPVDSYPNGYKDKIIKEEVFQHSSNYNSDDKVVECNNYRIIKHFINYYPFKKEIDLWIKNKSNKKKIIISYTASSMFLRLLKYAKKQDNSIQCICIIADLPEFISAKKETGIIKMYNSYESYKCKMLYKYVDKYVLLTKHMAKKLEIKSPFLVIEGISNTSKSTDYLNYEDYIKNDYIFYSGTLNYSFGIMTLLKAFSLIKNKNVNLIICGYGEAEKDINEYMKFDSRIRFLGKLHREEVLYLQRHAKILINPRQNSHEFTKYSFPSKNLEYLSSGAPLIAYKLDGIPDEYDHYIIYPKDNTIKELTLTIERILNMNDEERKKIGLKSKNFVTINKNNVIQAKKILDFINEN